MTDSVIKTRAQQMRDHLDGVANVINLFPNGGQQFRDTLNEASMQEVRDFDGLANLISLAHVALSLAEMGIDEGIYSHWYRDRGLNLLIRAMDALSVIEASCEPRSAAGLN